MTAIDLESIAFSDEEHGEACQYRQCGAEALFEGSYEALNDVPCCHGRILYCLPHRDFILELHRLHQLLGNAFTCPRCPGSRHVLIRMEPLR